jgi:hypothetical protein
MHEREDVVADRDRYLVECEELELRGPFWFQMKKSETSALADDLGTPPPPSHEYKVGDEDWVEFHVDVLKDTRDREQFGPQGGRMSVRLKEGIIESSCTTPAAEETCKYGHSVDVCKCHLPVLFAGQDEV